MLSKKSENPILIMVSKVLRLLRREFLNAKGRNFHMCPLTLVPLVSAVEIHLQELGVPGGS
jgi:hypothetical protein